MAKSRIEMRILSVLVYVAIAIAAACCIAAPWLLWVFGYESAYTAPLLVIGIAFIIAVWQLRGILRQVARGEPFSRANVVYLKHISWCCFAVAVAALGMMPIYFSLIKVLLALFAVAGGLVMRVLAWVFALAAQQKEELDLII